MESSWFGLEDAMELLTTSRRLTCRSSRVISSCALDSVNIESRIRRTRDGDRDRDMDRQFVPQQRSGFGESRRLHGIKTKSVFEDYCDFSKQTKSKFPSFREHKFRMAVEKPIEGDSTHYHDETDELKRKFQIAQEENLKLQAVITDLTQVNKRWQKYNNDRQLYVQRLLQTIEDQQEELKQISGLPVDTKKNSSEINTSSTSCSSMSCESDVDSIEQKLKERVEVLEFQVKAHRDDWEAELNEKKQALQDKQVAEKRAMELLVELQSIKRSFAAREEANNTQYLCHCCGHPCEPETYPTHNRVYRTALHLPYTVNRSTGSGKTYIFQNDIVFDGAESKKHPESVDESDTSSKTNQQDYFLNINEHITKKTDSSVRDVWQINQPGANNVDTQEVSYSRSSTIPLVSSPMQTSSLSTVTTPNHSETSLNDETVRLNCTQGLPTITSFVQIPISKSLSAPDRKADKFPSTPRKSVDSIKFSSVSPPVSFINPAGIATQTVRDVICPGCRAVFPPKMHLKFLDHFESCQIVKKN